MNSEIKMSVSSMTQNDGKRGVYVLFSDGNKSAEFVIGSKMESHCLPECKVISNKGFDEEELKQLRDYADNERDYIFSLAKTINPMKAFMGD